MEEEEVVLEFEAVLGHGSFGTVYLIKDKENRRVRKHVQREFRFFISSTSYFNTGWCGIYVKEQLCSKFENIFLVKFFLRKSIRFGNFRDFPQYMYLGGHSAQPTCIVY